MIAGRDGDGIGSTIYDAEIYSQSNKGFIVFPNENGKEDDHFTNSSSAFDRWLVMKVQAAGFAAYSDTGLNFKTYSLNLLQFGEQAASYEKTWYLGVNRVIEPYNRITPVASRDGEGLCSVCVRWNTVEDLNPPSAVPSLPDSDGEVTTTSEPDSCIETNSCEVCCEYLKITVG